MTTMYNGVQHCAHYLAQKSASLSLSMQMVRFYAWSNTKEEAP